MLHVVVEGAFEKRFLVRLLSDLQPACNFDVHASNGRNAARPLAKLFLVEDREPVAFVYDADTHNKTQVDRERREFEEYFAWGGTGAPFQVLPFVPEIEAVFFDPVEPLLRSLGIPHLPEVTRIAATYAPKEILETLLPASSIGGREELVDRLTEADLEALRRNSTVAALRAFVCTQATSAAATAR